FDEVSADIYMGLQAQDLQMTLILGIFNVEAQLLVSIEAAQGFFKKFQIIAAKMIYIKHHRHTFSELLKSLLQFADLRNIYKYASIPGNRKFYLKNQKTLYINLIDRK